MDLDPATQLALLRMSRRVRQRQLNEQLSQQLTSAASADLTALPPLSEAAKNAALQRIRLRVLSRDLPENEAADLTEVGDDIIVVEGFGPDSDGVNSEFEEAMRRIRERSRRRQLGLEDNNSEELFLVKWKRISIFGCKTFFCSQGNNGRNLNGGSGNLLNNISYQTMCA